VISTFFKKEEVRTSL